MIGENLTPGLDRIQKSCGPIATQFDIGVARYQVRMARLRRPRNGWGRWDVFIEVRVVTVFALAAFFGRA